ncbi:MAG: ABC transporter permease subunit [Armatimonadetes bacterium]|nr:ABC transporter permease subunit [Armatimonadota bacterium]MBS1725158.1 ABC transporter permease subunit [Armatimonadota bacterium]
MSAPVNSPIADLSYRHYDGPLESPVARWWSIAKMTMKMATKKRGFWGWSIFSAWWYIILLAVFWFVDNILGGGGAAGSSIFLKQIVWKDQFVHAFSFSQMILMVVALLVGASSIANDNRSNALLVYLSKPCTRFDYVFGKWLGVFLLITGVSLVPMMVFYLYGYMSFQDYGFWSQSPWLFLRLILVSAVAGSLHASLSLGVSSLFNQGRLAGATYAGMYFLSYIFTVIMAGFNSAAVFGGSKPFGPIRQLFYCSIDGIQIGMAKLIVGTDGSQIFPGMNGGPGRRRGPDFGGERRFNPEDLIIGAPHAAWIVPLFFFLVATGFLIAWSRVKAVEVV